MRKPSSASDGMVCVVPIEADDRLGAAAPALEQETERHRDRRLPIASAAERECEVLRGEAENRSRRRCCCSSRSSRPRSAAPAPPRRRRVMPRSRSTSRATTTSSSPLLLQAQVGRAHHVAVERAGEQRERGRDLGVALERLAADQRRGLVGREEVAVVVEHHQVVHQQAAVGGVGVEHVEVAAVDRLVLERLLHSLHAAELEAVGLGEAGQAVGPLDELVVEPCAQRLRNSRQVADGGEVPGSRRAAAGR